MTQQHLLRMLAYIVVVIAAMTSVYVASDRAIDANQRTNEQAINRDRASQLKACARVQILRDQVNGTAFLIYDAFVAGAKREAQLVKGDPANAAEHRRSQRESLKIARQQVVTGPTNCVASVDNPGTYRPPTPEFIWEHTARVEQARKRAALIIKAARSGKRLPPIAQLLREATRFDEPH